MILSFLISVDEWHESYLQLPISKAKLIIDVHRLKIQGGYLKFLPKSLGVWGGGSRLSEKLPGGPPILGFILLLHFYQQFFLKICQGGAVSYPPPPSPPCVNL
jgi:hypothetical protein